MTNIAANGQRIIEKNIFGLLWRDLVKIPVLMNVLFVPVKTGAFIQWASALFRHRYQYTINVYTSVRMHEAGKVHMPLLIKDSIAKSRFLHYS